MTNQIELSELESTQRTAEAISHIGGIRLFGEYIVDGTKSWSSHVVAVERLVFKPGARLLFDGNVVRRGPNVFIFAKEIISEEQEAVGEIGWDDPPPSERSAPGQGASGADNAQHTDTPGGPCATGPVGLSGEDGMDAPHLTLVTQAIIGGLRIALAGEEGGRGGPGGKGGAGGQGGRGRPASQTMFGCRRGAGNGAAGGSGGQGGPGGSGGDGGNGGTFTLVTDKDKLAAVTRLIRVDLAGGRPGDGGAGGEGGTGGPGGPGGQEARPFCRGNGRPGPTGGSGGPGSTGANGKPGNAGTFYVGGLKADDLDRALR